MTEEHNFKYTQYIIMNSDVKMGKGKAIAQACHASLGAYNNTAGDCLKWSWIEEGARKIILKANYEELMKVFNNLYMSKHIISLYIVKDFGLTQIPADTITALGVGPYEIDCLKEYVKDLKLM